MTYKRQDVKPIDSLTLEHILPKNTQNWDQNEFFKNYPRSDMKMDDFVERLGNFTLLHDAVNKKLQNATFKIKKNGSNDKPGYVKSKLNINKQTVCNYDEWTALVIEEREKELAKHASVVWDLDML